MEKQFQFNPGGNLQAWITNSVIWMESEFTVLPHFKLAHCFTSFSLFAYFSQQGTLTCSQYNNHLQRPPDSGNLWNDQIAFNQAYRRKPCADIHKPMCTQHHFIQRTSDLEILCRHRKISMCTKKFRHVQAQLCFDWLKWFCTHIGFCVWVCVNCPFTAEKVTS